MNLLQDHQPLLKLLINAQFTVIDADLLSLVHSIPFNPGIPTLLVGRNAEKLDSVIKQVRKIYPSTTLVNVQTTSNEIIEVELEKISLSQVIGVLIPELTKGSSMEEFVEIIANLRDPDTGCPWDKEQTFSTLRKHLLEESFEALDAIDQQDTAKMEEEFGDILLMIVMYSQIGQENGSFNIYTVLHRIAQKMIRRHPHIFGTTAVDGVNDVLTNWQKIKEQERKDNGEIEKGVLDGLPRSMPALSQGLELQARAAKVGFDWPDITGVLEKISEEIREIEASETVVEIEGELGDLLFVLVNYARWKKIDPEVALHRTNAKFRARFKYIEQQLRLKKMKFEDVGLAELDALWNEAKAKSS